MVQTHNGDMKVFTSLTDHIFLCLNEYGCTWSMVEHSFIVRRGRLRSQCHRKSGENRLRSDTPRYKVESGRWGPRVAWVKYVRDRDTPHAVISCERVVDSMFRLRVNIVTARTHQSEPSNGRERCEVKPSPTPVAPTEFRRWQNSISSPRQCACRLLLPFFPTDSKSSSISTRPTIRDVNPNPER